MKIFIWPENYFYNFCFHPGEPFGLNRFPENMKISENQKVLQLWNPSIQTSTIRLINVWGVLKDQAIFLFMECKKRFKGIILR